MKSSHCWSTTFTRWPAHTSTAATVVVVVVVDQAHAIAALSCSSPVHRVYILHNHSPELSLIYWWPMGGAQPTNPSTTITVSPTCMCISHTGASQTHTYLYSRQSPKDPSPDCPLFSFLILAQFVPLLD